MRGFVDLHCHYVPRVDDGVRTAEESIALLRGLRAAGFDHVVATPHIRPQMFDNDAPTLRGAFAALEDRLACETELPTRALSAEHFFDDVVHGRLMRGEALPYPQARAVLLEFSYEVLPIGLHARFFELRGKRLRPIVAHPERYEPFHRKPREAQEAMRKAGGVLLLDVAALEGKYGERARRTAETLLDQQAYYAACSDAHRPEDADVVAAAIARLEQRVGATETKRLLSDGPKRILGGNVLDAFD